MVFYSRILNINRGSLHTRSFSSIQLVYTSPFLDAGELKLNDFVSPKSYRGFRETAPRCHIWVEFVNCSLLCFKKLFSVYSGFPLSSKTNWHFQIPIRTWNALAFLNEFLWTPRCSVVNKLFTQKKTLTFYSRESPILTIFHRVDVVVWVSRLQLPVLHKLVQSHNSLSPDQPS